MVKNLYTTETSYQIRIHRFYLDGDIDKEEDYRDLIDILLDMEQEDKLEIIINSFGGYSHIAQAICNAISITKGQVTGILLGVCQSAASCIALACHDLQIADTCEMLIHNARLDISGNTNEVLRRYKFYEKEELNYFSRVYKDFLTEDEIQGVIDGKDIWLNSKEILERYTKRKNLRTS